jgi:hypothetical protein
MTIEPRFQIGQQFKTRGKHPCLCTIVDILKTYNSKGEQVRLRYVATHEFMGQAITDHDVVDSTIAMGFVA